MFEEEEVKELKAGWGRERREKVGERNRGFVVWNIKEGEVEGKELGVEGSLGLRGGKASLPKVREKPELQSGRPRN